MYILRSPFLDEIFAASSFVLKGSLRVVRLKLNSNETQFKNPVIEKRECLILGVVLLV